MKGFFFKTPSATVQGRSLQRFFSLSENDIAGNETIFSAVTIKAKALASLPFNVKKDYKNLNAYEHNLANLFENGANPNMTMYEFIELLETIRNLKGIAYAIKEYDVYGDISAMYVLNNDFVFPLVNEETKELYYKIGERIIHSDHILTFKYASVDGVNAISPIKVLKNTIQYDNNIKTLSQKQLENNIGLNYAFRVTGNLDAKKIAEYHEMVEEYIKRGIIYLDSGKSLEELKSKSPIDTKLFEMEEITVSKVARVFHIPVQKIMPNKNSYKSAEENSLEFMIDTILPTVRMYEQEFRKKCLSETEKMDGYNVKINMNGFARADMKTRGEFYFKMMRSGAMTPNEIRALEDLPPCENGDELLVSRDLIKLSNLDNLITTGQEVSAKNGEVLEDDEE